jgi:hypothetical protein
MKDNGGGRCWDWSEAQVEAKLITMGLEDIKLESKKPRRRRRVRNSQGSTEVHDVHGANALSFPHPLQLTSPSPQYNRGLYANSAPHLSSEQKDQLIDEIYQLKSEASSPMSVDGVLRNDEDFMSSESQHGYSVSPDFRNPQGDPQSERIARQACGQYILEESTEHGQYQAQQPPRI